MARRRRKRNILKSVKGIITFAVTFIVVTVAGLIAYSVMMDRPQDLPWTELKLDDPVGFFTGRKLAGLAEEYQKCQGLLDEAGVAYQPFPVTGTDQCRRDDNITMLTSGAGRISYDPVTIAPSCPVVAALTVWENQVVQPAAIEFFGQKVARIRHFGSFSCRSISGSDRWSEHATANAIDIAAFTLIDGKAVTLVGDWEIDGPESLFLKQVRDQSCDLFATVLSPDYNAAHADHFHLDQASRGAMGYRLCR